MIDSFYTPPLLAEQLVGFSTQKVIKRIADFCVGDGELLRAAARRWPTAKLIATDLSPKALVAVSKNHPQWITGKCDFLNETSRRKCRALSGLDGKVDLIFMNPPFSCLGGTKHSVQLDGVQYTCSTAMKFVVTALHYMSKKGRIYAILPHSVGYSERDRLLWRTLVENYSLRILSKSGNNHFKGCSPHIILISLNTSGHACVDGKVIPLRIPAPDVSVSRGSIPMNEARKAPSGIYPLVHSTNLQGNRIQPSEYLMAGDRSLVKGPAVLIPRVGTPRKDKICRLPAGKSVVLSDCVIALKTKSAAESKALQGEIMEKWDAFRLIYQGTGARYVALSTIKRVMGV